MAEINSTLGCFAFCRELNKGKPCYSLTATGGTNSGNATITFAAGSSDNDGNLYPAGGVAALAADLFNGLEVFFVNDASGGNLTGKIYSITDTVWAADVLTITLDGTTIDTPASGDEVLILGRLRASGFNPTIGNEDLPLDDFVRASWDRAPSLKGLETCSGSFNCYLPALQSAVTGSTVAKDRYASLLETMFSRREVPALTTSGTGSTVSKLAVTDGSNHAVGDAIVIDGHKRRVIEIDLTTTPDEVHFAPDIPSGSVPGDGETIQGGELFTPLDTGQETVTFIHLMDTQLREFSGCMIDIGSISGEFGQLVTMEITFDGEGWALYDSQTADAYLSSNGPQAMLKSAFHFNGTLLPKVTAFSFALGVAREVYRSSGTSLSDGGQEVVMTDRQATMATTFQNQSKAHKATTEALGTTARMEVQLGNEAPGIVGFSGLVQCADPSSYEDQSSISHYNQTWAFRDRHNADATPPQISRH